MLAHAEYLAVVSVGDTVVQGVLDAHWEAGKIPSSRRGTEAIAPFSNFPAHTLAYSVFVDKLKVEFETGKNPMLSARLIGTVEFSGMPAPFTTVGQGVEIRLKVAMRPAAVYDATAGLIALTLHDGSLESMQVRSSRGVPIPMHVTDRLNAVLTGGLAKSLIGSLLANVNSLVPPIKVPFAGPFAGFDLAAAGVECRATDRRINFGLNLSITGQTAFFGAESRLGTTSSGAALGGFLAAWVIVVVNPRAFRFVAAQVIEKAQAPLAEFGASGSFTLVLGNGSFNLHARVLAPADAGVATADAVLVPLLGKDDEFIPYEDEDSRIYYDVIKGHDNFWIRVDRLNLEFDVAWWVDVLGVVVGGAIPLAGPIGSVAVSLAIRLILDEIRTVALRTVRQGIGTISGPKKVVATLPETNAEYAAEARTLYIHPDRGIELSSEITTIRPAIKVKVTGPTQLTDAEFLDRPWIYQLQTTLGPYAADPTLRLRWQVYSKKKSDPVIVQDRLFSDGASRFLALDLRIADRREYSSYRINVSAYRLTADGAESVATDALFLTIGDSSGMDESKAFVQWKHEVAIPIRKPGPGGALVVVDYIYRKRTSAIHRTRHLARCKFAISALKPSKTWPKEVKYFDELPFSTDEASIAAHRSQLCEYCFFGGPGRNELTLSLVNQDARPWYRKHDGPAPYPARVPEMKAHWYPTGLADLVNLVKWAEKHPPSSGQPAIRASGSHWSLSDAATTTANVVETGDPTSVAPRMNRLLRNVVGKSGCLSDAAVSFFGNQAVTAFDPMAPVSTLGNPDEPFYLFHVESGIRIYELYQLLDRGEEGRSDFDRSLASVLPQYKGPWAMATLGGAGGQTLAGVVQTATHGGDVRLPPIVDYVQAIHLVGAGGKQYWIERSLPGGVQLTDDAKLRATLGSDLEILRSPDAFWATAVNVGRFGIIHSLVVRAVRQYALQQTSVTGMTWTQLQSRLSLTDPLFRDNRFVQALVTMWPSINTGDLDCMLSLRKAMPLASAGNPVPLGRAERTGANNGKSAPLGQGDFLSRMSEKGSLTALTGPLDPIFPGLAQVVALARDERSGPEPTVTLGDQVAAACNYLAAAGRVDLVRQIVTMALQNGIPGDMTAISYAVMDIHDYNDVGVMTRGDSAEIFFDATGPALRTFINRVVTRAAGVTVNGRPAAVVGWMSLRFMRASEALLAMQQWRLTCAVEIACLGGVDGTEPFLAAVEQEALAAGGVMHWGQRNLALTRPAVDAAYASNDAIGRWRAVLRQLTGNGTQTSFSTPFSVRVGLEP
jgi:hypothetical protein